MLQGIDHINIAAPYELLLATRNFYCEALGMMEGPRPAFNFRGFWLYGGDRPLIHLMECERDATDCEALATVKPYLDHVAFNMSGADAYVARLHRLGITCQTNHIVDFDIFQVFTHDPCGNGVEVNFKGEVLTELLPS
ncbi:MAG: hypothetical protein ACK5ME_04700 [Parahaliea sp.]